MKTNPGFDEVMIVNPFNPLSNNQQQIKLMKFFGPQHYFGKPMGYYGEPPDYGYYGEPPDYGEYEPMGYLAEEQPYGGYGEPQDYGYYAQAPEYGYYGEAPEYGHYAEPPDYGEYEPVGYFAEEQPYGWYCEPGEMVGYGQYEPLSEYPHGVGHYGEPDISGYVRQVPVPPFNPGCPMPTNVAGFAEAEPFAGYTRPATVNPTCGQFTPQPGITEQVPETFRPLW